MTVRSRIVIVGAGGQGRDVAWLIDEINRATPRYEVLGFVVSDLGRLGPNDSKDRVLGDYTWLEANLHQIDAVALGIGSPAARLKVAAEIAAAFPELDWPALIHPSASFERSTARLGRGVTICAGVIGTVNLVVADFALINPACTLGHEASIGAGCVINHASSISGGVLLGEGVLVGTGARILQYLTVGPAARVGAGAVVTRNVAAGITVVGVPARPVEAR